MDDIPEKEEEELKEESKYLMLPNTGVSEGSSHLREEYLLFKGGRLNTRTGAE